MKNKIVICISAIGIVVTLIFLKIYVTNKTNTGMSNNIKVGDIINNTDSVVEQEEIFNDSRIGTLTIPKINLFDIEICESVELETLAHSIGHFENTNIYDGNVGLASHNIGTNANYFENLHKLKIGDEIYYKTKYGTKKYLVDNITNIDSYDWSKLEQTDDNRITLITCISGSPDLRLCVQGIEE